MQLSYDDYDKITEYYFDRAGTPTFWPSLEQIDKFELAPDRWLLFACYLYEKGEPPKTRAEDYSKKNLQAFINRHLDLVDHGTQITYKPIVRKLLACLREGDAAQQGGCTREEAEELFRKYGMAVPSKEEV